MSFIATIIREVKYHIQNGDPKKRSVVASRGVEVEKN